MKIEKTNGLLRNLSDRVFSYIEELTGSRPQRCVTADRYSVNGQLFVALRERGLAPNSVFLCAKWDNRFIEVQRVTQNPKGWYRNPEAQLIVRADKPKDFNDAVDFIRCVLGIKGVSDQRPYLLSEELGDITGLAEGAICRVTINAYERNPLARQGCIDHHGTSCCICQFNFESRYGNVARDYIHVHHIRPLSEIGSEYIVNPVEDLRPVCPNCHAILHRRIPAYSLDEVKAFLLN
jgi:HNH endonuclease